jgi:hypothetical protein
MTVTKEIVVRTILKHLNGEMSEAELVAWAEGAFVALSESDTDHPDEDALLDVLGAIGAGDTPGFPLTWAALREHLTRLGMTIHVEVA